MAKLSRITKYQDLRDRLEQETTAATAASTSGPVKLTRMSRTEKAQAAHASEPAQPTSATPEVKEQQAGVMDGLLDEVKQYNIDKGDRIMEDTQINILRTLDDNIEQDLKRRSHLEIMEENEDAGGRTMNIYTKDIKEVSRPVETAAAEKTAEQPDVEKTLLLGQQGLSPDAGVGKDELQLFDLGADDFDKTIRQDIPSAKNNRKEKNASRKEKNTAEPKKEAKAAAPAAKPAEPAKINKKAAAKQKKAAEKAARKEEKNQSSGKGGTIAIIILILVLIATICYTLYLISQASIF